MDDDRDHGTDDGRSPRPAGRTPAALLEAQRLAFSPVFFVVAMVLRRRGMLRAIREGGRAGASDRELSERSGVPLGGTKMLLETALAFDLLEELEPRRYRLARLGLLWERDEMTRVNADFVFDVCLAGLPALEASVVEERPAGLPALAGAHGGATIYEVLTSLAEPARSSWFAFDHYYSDSAFESALCLLLARPSRRWLDVGGNTGRFARLACARDPEVRVTIADHAATLEHALGQSGEFAARIDGFAVDLLDARATLPEGHDLVWMSQFLVCFGDADVLRILRLARASLAPQGTLAVLETFWDGQPNPIATTCVAGMSPYFPLMANGKSRVFRESDLTRLLVEAGFTIVARHPHLGRGHTLLLAE
ncbi:MAG: class I SAM-dependent methyltransferase [Myxococcota bacterium]